MAVNGVGMSHEYGTMSELLNYLLKDIVINTMKNAFYSSPDLAALAPVMTKEMKTPRKLDDLIVMYDRHLEKTASKQAALVKKYSAAQNIIETLRNEITEKPTFDERIQDRPDTDKVGAYTIGSLRAKLDDLVAQGTDNVADIALKNALAMFFGHVDINSSQIDFELTRVETVKNNAEDLPRILRNSITAMTEIATNFAGEKNLQNEYRTDYKNMTVDDAVSQLGIPSIFINEKKHISKIVENRKDMALGMEKGNKFRGFLPKFNNLEQIPIIYARPGEGKNQTMYALSKLLGMVNYVINIPTLDKARFGMPILNPRERVLEQVPVKEIKDHAKRAGITILDEIARTDEVGISVLDVLHSLLEKRVMDTYFNEASILVGLTNTGNQISEQSTANMDPAMLSRLVPLTVSRDASAARYAKFISDKYAHLVPSGSPLENFLMFIQDESDMGGMRILQEEVIQHDDIEDAFRNKQADKRSVELALNALTNADNLEDVSTEDIVNVIKNRCGPKLASYFRIFSRTVGIVPTVKEMQSRMQKKEGKEESVKWLDAVLAFDTDPSVGDDGTIAYSSFFNETFARLNGYAYLPEADRNEKMSEFRTKYPNDISFVETVKNAAAVKVINGYNPTETLRVLNKEVPKIFALGHLSSVEKQNIQSMRDTADQMFAEEGTKPVRKEIRYGLNELSIQNIIRARITGALKNYVNSFCESADEEWRIEQDRAKDEKREPIKPSLDGYAIVDIMKLMFLYPFANGRNIMVQEAINFLMEDPKVKKVVTEYGVSYEKGKEPVKFIPEPVALQKESEEDRKKRLKNNICVFEPRKILQLVSERFSILIGRDVDTPDFSDDGQGGGGTPATGRGAGGRA